MHALRYGAHLGATWLDPTRPPGSIVWLLAVARLDEFSTELEAVGQIAAREGTNLYPSPLDYARLELDQRRLDTGSFAEAARRDARALIARARPDATTETTIAGIPVAALWKRDGDYLGLFLAVSSAPVRGQRSRLAFPLTTSRFLLIAEAVRQAARNIYPPEILADEPREIPEELRQFGQDPRVFLLLFEVPR